MRRFKNLAGHVFLVSMFWLGSLHSEPRTIPKQFHGNFVGISLISVVNGLSFDESLTSLIVSEKGLEQHQMIDGHKFLVQIPSHWLLTLQDTQSPAHRIPRFALARGPKNLATLLSPNHREVQTVTEFKSKYSFSYLFSRLKFKLGLSDFKAPILVQKLADGSSLPVAVFYPSSTHRDALERIYQMLREQIEMYSKATAGGSDSAWRDSHLEFELVDTMLKDPQSPTFRESLSRISQKFSDQSEDEAHDRIALLTTLLFANELLPTQKTEVLRSLRLTGASSLIADLIADQLDLHLHYFGLVPQKAVPISHYHSLLLTAAADAARAHLALGYEQLTTKARAIDRWGTLSIKEIRQNTAGRIDADDFKLLQDLEYDQHRPDLQVYHLSHYNRLLKSYMEAQKLIELFAQNGDADSAKHMTGPLLPVSIGSCGLSFYPQAI